MNKILPTTFRLAILVCAFSLLGGCAHSIRISPDCEKLPLARDTVRSTKVVGYFISDEERNRRVITPGGGGDKVEYAPYKELEAGFFRVLNNVFADVHSLKSIDDKAMIADKRISIVMRPTITTTRRPAVCLLGHPLPLRSALN